MWRIAQGEKSQRRFGVPLIQTPPDQRLADLWGLLDETERLTLIQIARGWVYTRQGLANYEKYAAGGS